MGKGAKGKGAARGPAGPARAAVPTEDLPRRARREDVHGPGCNFVFPPDRDGVFEYAFPNRLFRYRGTWVNGEKHGKGRFSIGENDYYEGDFSHGEITGHGKRVFANGTSYEGSFVEGEFHGKGLWKGMDGTTYHGHFHFGQRHGRGVLTAPDGSVYTGMFDHHRKHGHGEMKFAEGDVFDGEFQDDAITGHGKRTYANGDVYEGAWQDGRRIGEGTMTYAASGVSVGGVWVEDRLEDYDPTGIELCEMPVLAPSASCEITASVIGARMESGRVLRFTVELCRVDVPTPKKGAAVRRGVVVDKPEPKLMVLNEATGETFVDVATVSGVGTLAWTPPSDASETTCTFSITVRDLSEPSLGTATAEVPWQSSAPSTSKSAVMKRRGAAPKAPVDKRASTAKK